MTDAGFFRGTSADQDNRFANKQKKLLKELNFSPVLNTKLNMSKIDIDMLRPWIDDKIKQILDKDDELLTESIYEHLAEKEVDGKNILVLITGFVSEDRASKFMEQLWTKLIEIQEKSVNGQQEPVKDDTKLQTNLKQTDPLPKQPREPQPPTRSPTSPSLVRRSRERSRERSHERSRERHRERPRERSRSPGSPTAKSNRVARLDSPVLARRSRTSGRVSGDRSPPTREHSRERRKHKKEKKHHRHHKKDRRHRSSRSPSSERKSHKKHHKKHHKHKSPSSSSTHKRHKSR